MKKMTLAVSLALAATATSAQAADLDREIGLIVSGVVEKWAGVQFIDDGNADDTVMVSGGEGLLSLPLGDNLSIQSDVKYEYNSYALENLTNNDVFGPRYSFQAAAHLSWRDPSRGLFGVFGGAGTAASGFYPSNVKHDVAFVGGEAQVYFDNITLYAQGGLVDFDPSSPSFAADGEGMTDGLFARGVLRWFLGSDSRLQLEGTYITSGMQQTGVPDVDVFSVGAQYDFVLAGLPIIGSTPLFIGYRGTFRNNCNFSSNVDDHVFMVGTSYSFSGDRLTVDRQGATLDTPDFNVSCIND
jgi:opacity protein-like surface antigen